MVNLHFSMDNISHIAADANAAATAANPGTAGPRKKRSLLSRKFERKVETVMSFFTNLNVTMANSGDEWVDNVLRNTHHIQNQLSSMKQDAKQLFREYTPWDAKRLSKYYQGNARRLVNLFLNLEFGEMLFPDRFSDHRRNVAQKLIRFIYHSITIPAVDSVKSLKQTSKVAAFAVRQLIRTTYKELVCMRPRLERMAETQSRQPRIPIEPLLDDMMQVLNSRGRCHHCQ